MRQTNWEDWITNKRTCKRWLNVHSKKGMLRKKALSKMLYIQKARHNLDFANWVKQKHKEELPTLFGEERFYDWVINAYYYAIYHAALALISEKGYFSKSHNATLCAVIWFYYHQQRSLEKQDIKLISECIDKKDVEIIANTKSLRERASYAVSTSFELALVEEARANAISFLSKAKKILGI